MPTENPAPDRRVFVGVPIRNGGDTLRHALDSLLAQTHADLTIFLSDNASSDDTAEVCAEYLARDGRIRYHRHEHPLTAIQNWRFAYEQADAPYFMWSADDDLHSSDFVEELLAALEANPRCGLAFGQIVHFTDYAHWADQPVYDYHCDTRGRSITYRLWHDKNGPFFPYGLQRPGLLADYQWYEHTVSPDWPLAIYLLATTDIVQVERPRFYYKGPGHVIPHEVRAATQSFSDPEDYLTVRLAWRCALATSEATRRIGKRRVLLVDFAVIFAGILWANRRRLLSSVREDLRTRGRRRDGAPSTS